MSKETPPPKGIGKMDILHTREGEPDILLHDKETDIEPALRNLVGKRLSRAGETTDTVSLPHPFPERNGGSLTGGGGGQTFAAEDLPPGTRVIEEPDSDWGSSEHAPSRLTVIVGADGTISHVFTG